MKRCAPMIILCLLLASCGSKEATSEELTLSMRTAYLGMTGFSGTASVTADYGDKVYAYEVSCSGGPDQGTLEVTAPDNIAGLFSSWSNEGGVLEYDGAVLETGELSEDGLSPADALPLILAACRSGGVVESGSELLGEDEALYVLLRNPNDPEEERSRVAIWVNENDFTLLKAEISWDGYTVIRMEFDQFSLEQGGNIESDEM